MSLRANFTGHLSRISALCNTSKGPMLCVTVSNYTYVSVEEEGVKNYFDLVFFGTKARELSIKLRVGMRVSCVDFSILTKKNEKRKEGQKSFFVGGEILPHKIKFNKIIIPF